jgi:hypothetical protein
LPLTTKSIPAVLLLLNIAALPAVTLPAIPVPPTTTRAPVVVLVDAVESLNNVIPEFTLIAYVKPEITVGALTIYNDAAFIYPPKIHMTPLECDIWISETMSKLNELEEYREYFFDRVIYWRLEKSGCYTIKRDKKWFAEKLPELSRMWTYVEFFRTNSDLAAILNNFIEKLPIKQNNKILEVIKYMYDTKLENPKLDQESYINTINEYTSVLLKPKPVKARPYIRCD